MRIAFWGASNMRMSTTDVPDLSGVSDMSDMFANASAFNQDINGWNVSHTIIHKIVGLNIQRISLDIRN